MDSLHLSFIFIFTVYSSYSTYLHFVRAFIGQVPSFSSSKKEPQQNKSLLESFYVGVI